MKKILSRASLIVNDIITEVGDGWGNSDMIVVICDPFKQLGVI